MKISYKKLWILLIEKEISPAKLRKDLSIATGTMTKLRRNEEVALSVLLRICEYLDCDIGDICEAVRTDIVRRRDCYGFLRELRMFGQ
ncbi:MAG: helix-turn-helix transcriptional regulator [Ruminococcus sp.]|nr:helix-turn-helix transcriptional regulator [Ruminococcus sp.]